MTHTIQHYMWGFQTHLRLTLQHNADRLFQELDNGFQPKLFVVGVLAESREERYTACVDPENDFWISSEYFKNTRASAELIRSKYPERNIIHSHPIAQQSHDENLLKRSIKDAVAQLIDNHPSKPCDYVFDVSYPSLIDSYWVCVVLGLQKKLIEKYPTLTQTNISWSVYRTLHAPTSLIDAVSLEFLKHACNELQKPNPGSGLTEIDTDFVLRSAGRSFIAGIGRRVDKKALYGPFKLFRGCGVISSLLYEKSIGSGRLLLAKKNHPAISQKVEFQEPAKLNDFRTTRKMLQLTSNDLFLQTNSEDIFGLSAIENYDSKKEDIFTIHVLGRHLWELRHVDNVLMRVEFGLPSLPRPSFDEQSLIIDLPRIFQGMTSATMTNLIALIRQAEGERHGTMLIVSDEAEAEAKRLGRYGTALKPCFLTPEILKHLTPIDGAILLSPDGICHGIGMILDGKATPDGDPGRGARYNSAIKYIGSTTVPCMAIVISEDGGIDIMPSLLPPIARSKLDAIITEIRKLAEASTINRNTYVSLCEWIDRHTFYLRAEDCRVLNSLIPLIEERLSKQEEFWLRPQRSDFSPHPDMDENLYYLKD